MANKHRGEVALQLGERTVTLRPTFDAMVAIEDGTGEPMLRLMQRVSTRDLLIKQAAVIAFEGAKAAGDPLLHAEIKAALPEFMIALLAGASAFIINAVAGGAEPEEPEKNGAAPMEGQAPT